MVSDLIHIEYTNHEKNFSEKLSASKVEVLSLKLVRPTGFSINALLAFLPEQPSNKFNRIHIRN